MIYFIHIAFYLFSLPSLPEYIVTLSTLLKEAVYFS